MNRKVQNILLFLLPALLAYHVGLLALGRHLVDWNSLAAAAHAYDVFHKLPQANMALIGFVQPPLPALLYLPLSYLFPTWLASGSAAPLLGAAFLGFSVLLLADLGRVLGLRWWLWGPVTALFALHPLTLSYAALGHPAIILVCTYLGLARCLVRWHRDGTVRDLVAGAIYGAVAIMVAYEAIVPVLAAALFILRCCRRTTDAPSKAEGTLVTFLLPVAYVVGVWLVANWVIMEDAWHFWRMSMASTQRLPVMPVDNWLQPVIVIAIVVQPLLLATIYQALRPVASERLGQSVAWLAVAALFSPLLFPTLRSTSSAPAFWAPLMPLAAATLGFGFPLLATALHGCSVADVKQRRHLFSAGVVIIAMGGLVLAFHLQTTNHGLPTGLRSTYSGYAASGHVDTDERAVAAWLNGQVNPALRNYIAGWPGFAIAMYGRLEKHVEVLPTIQPPSANTNLQAGSVVVLLNSAEGDSLPLWQARLPQYLQLVPEWQQGKWIVYRVSLRALPATQ